MPIYVYGCEECGERFEKLVSMSAGSNPQTCPKCGAEKTRKLPAASNFVGVKSASSSSCSGCTSSSCAGCH